MVQVHHAPSGTVRRQLRLPHWVVPQAERLGRRLCPFWCDPRGTFLRSVFQPAAKSVQHALGTLVVAAVLRRAQMRRQEMLLLVLRQAQTVLLPFGFSQGAVDDLGFCRDAVWSFLARSAVSSEVRVRVLGEVRSVSMLPLFCWPSISALSPETSIVRMSQCAYRATARCGLEQAGFVRDSLLVAD
jgi:hypothetical protein